MKVLSSCALLVFIAGHVLGDERSPIGLWKTIDDKTGRPKALVRIFDRNGELFGKIEAGFEEREKHTCELCKDDRKDKPLIGMEIIRHMKKTGNEYTGGDILDPDSGYVYRCKFRVDDGGKKLLVRGFIGISLLGRTQTWIREK